MSRQPNLAAEEGLWAQGYRRIAGLDEAGRGAWAGPVVAAAVILPPGRVDLCGILAPVRDSKLLTPRVRERCYDLIAAIALTWGVGFSSADEIDRWGIVEATRQAMGRALARLSPSPDCLIIDALPLPTVPLPQHVSFKADRHHLSVAAASVMAKVSRDRWMVTLDEQIEGYGLARHKGYGTAKHRAALQALGASCEHRRSFAPLRELEPVAVPPEPLSPPGGSRPASKA